MVSFTPRPYFTPGKGTVPIVQEDGWAPGPVWTGGNSRPTGIRSPDRPARSQSLYQLSYRALRRTQYYIIRQEICAQFDMSGASGRCLQVVNDSSDFFKNTLKLMN